MEHFGAKILRYLKAGRLIGVAVLLIFILTGSALLLARYKSQGLSFPQTLLGANVLGGLNKVEATAQIARIAEEFAKTPVLLQWRDLQEYVAPQDLGITLNVEQTVQRVNFIDAESNLIVLLQSFRRHTISPAFAIHEVALEERTKLLFPAVPRMRNASFTESANGLLSIRPAQSGWRIQEQELALRIERAWQDGNKIAITLPAVAQEPTVFSIDLEEARDRLLASLERPLTLHAPEEEWVLIPRKYVDFIRFTKVGAQLHWELDPFPLEKLIAEELAPALERPEEPTKIFYNEKGNIMFEGRATPGVKILIDELLGMIALALDGGQEGVHIPLRDIPAPLIIDPTIQELGITELIGVGHSTFYRSPENRVHNIGVGISRYNGLLIAPNETFSFNEHLGRVDETTGYRKELVIKPEGTIPEYGGGLCQVSTTLYRAALYSGMPIVERSPHSYAVTYYAQVGGHGIDATIYPPSKDLKFTNDTPSHLLIQAYRDGYEAFYKFYGTADGRTIEMDGPYVENKRVAPTEPVLFPTNDLPPGERKQVQKPVDGFDTTWYRIIRDVDGNERAHETLFSQYDAIPPKYQVGGERISAEGENAGLVENTSHPLSGEFTD